MDPTSTKLSKERLPPDWYDRFGDRLIQHLVDFSLDHYLWLHQRSCTHIPRFEDVPRWQRILDDVLLNGHLSLEAAWCVANKLAVAYQVTVWPESFPHLSTRELTQIFCGRNWAEEAFSHWTEQSDPKEREDGRYVLGLMHSSRSVCEAMGRWIGLGGPATGGEDAIQQQEGIKSLIEKHVQLCDLVQACIYKAAGSRYHDEFPSGSDGLHHIDGEARYYHSALTPTARAVFMVTWCDIPKKRTVLLVLTGHNEDMRSGPATFTSLRESDIIAHRCSGVVEVRLETAIRYLHQLNALEERVNEDLKRTHAARRARLHKHFRDGAKSAIEDLRARFHASADGSILSESSELQTAWQAIVEEESIKEKL
ncbi:hypothetical protein AC578_11153 [Pseudocercospora eumusae]|uniref:Uncharacterized protein n=1 Tax=Pseudocercospora eumusae TaxID=321146 RepID=A0A139GY84_9PEZI|nr:hypothetical protein AC578_11153 [Pseudocercospora eumusae]